MQFIKVDKLECHIRDWNLGTAKANYAMKGRAETLMNKIQRIFNENKPGEFSRVKNSILTFIKYWRKNDYVRSSETTQLVKNFVFSAGRSAGLDTEELNEIWTQGVNL